MVKIIITRNSYYRSYTVKDAETKPYKSLYDLPDNVWSRVVGAGVGGYINRWNRDLYTYNYNIKAYLNGKSV